MKEFSVSNVNKVVKADDKTYMRNHTVGVFTVDAMHQNVPEIASQHRGHGRDDVLEFHQRKHLVVLLTHDSTLSSEQFTKNM